MLGALQSRAWLVLVVLALVLGCSLRFYQLGADGLWSDELFTSSMVTQHPLRLTLEGFRRTTVFEVTPSDHFWTAKGAEQSPPLFELLTKLVVRLFGRSEVSFRLVSALAGSAWLAFLAAAALRSADRDRRLIYTFALVFGALALPLVEYSQEGRSYMLGSLFTGILTVRWLERWQDGFWTAPLPGWGEVALFVLGCHCHYNVVVFSALLLSSYGLAALRARRFRELLRLAVVPLACVPWVTLNAHTILFTSQGGVRWREFSRVEALAGGARCAFALLDPPLVALLAIVAWLMLGRRLFGGQAPSSASWTGVYVLATLVFVDVALVALVTRQAGMEHPRYYLFALPAMHLAAALVLAATSRDLRWAIPVTLAFAAMSLTNMPDYYARQKEGYREITQWLATQVKRSTPLVYTWGPNLGIYRLYLEHNFGRKADDRAIPISYPQEAPAICDRLKTAPRVALIAHATHRPLAAEALNACAEKYELSAEREIGNVVGQVWTRAPVAAHGS